MNSLLVFENKKELWSTWRYLLEQRGFHFLVTDDEERAVAFCRDASPDAILADGEALTKNGRDQRLAKKVRAAAPGAFLIALWPGRGGGLAATKFCREADYNIPANRDFPVLLRLLDCALSNSQGAVAGDAVARRRWQKPGIGLRHV